MTSGRGAAVVDFGAMWIVSLLVRESTEWMIRDVATDRRHVSPEPDSVR
jgi:hypothetical protein